MLTFVPISRVFVLIKSSNVYPSIFIEIFLLRCLEKIDERYSLTIILVSAPTPCFTLTVWDTHPVHEIPVPYNSYQMFPCIFGALLWIHRAPEPLPLLLLLLLLLDAIVLNCFYVFRKGLIQFSECIPIQNTCPN